MRTLIEEHGGAIATAAIVIIIIAAIVALGQTGHLQTVFTALIDPFTCLLYTSPSPRDA